MACVSSHSPVPQRTCTGHPNERNGEVMQHRRVEVPSNQHSPFAHHHSVHPPVRSAPVPHTHVISTQAHPTISAFKQIKSPISQCIDTIIGAAEVIEKRGSFIDDGPQQSHRGRKSSKKGNSRRLPRVPVKTKNGTFDPIEELLENDAELQKKLVLTMALQRPRQPINPHPTKVPPRVIQDGFYWKDYPALESVLYDYMAEYYDWSTKERQSKHQQAFNNALVEKVRTVACEEGHEFDPIHFTDKRLRDRIRCFYKTHLQNAKKRLQTMKKHIGSLEHRMALENLIEQAQNSPNHLENRLVPAVSTSDDESDTMEPPKRKRQRSE